MKKFLFAALTAIAIIYGGSAFSAEPQPILPGSGPNVRDVTIAQIYRYAREMYRFGNYPEAIKAFKRMLTVDCSNAVAQYHLMKIARQSPEYADLNAYLKNLPCPQHNFEEEDFLPASLYYESDAALMQEQLTFYNKRFRIAKETLQNAADNYTKLTKELEEEIGSLRQQLTAAAEKPAKDIALLKDKLNTSRETAVRMDKEIAKLKEQLTAERKRRQNESDLLNKELAKGENAVLQKKELELKAKDQELSTLQQKFEDIQNRLRAIQASIEDKNAAIKTLETHIQDATSMKESPAPVKEPPVDNPQR